ncbi:MAG: vanadium-dependent haloperoxidase, partial [Phycisphaeraceae bacterium]
MLRELNRYDRENRPQRSGDTAVRSARAAAMMHGAIFDAINGISGRYEPYRMTREEQTPASREAATMEAAFVVLEGLFGEHGDELAGRGIVAQTQNVLNSARQTELVRLMERIRAGDLTEEKMRAGMAWGREVGEAMLRWREEDGSHITEEYNDFLVEKGRYRMDELTPDANIYAAEPFWGHRIEPFVLERITQFTVPGPPSLDSDEWKRDLAEVRELGRRERYNPANYPGGELPPEVDYQYRTAFFWASKGLQPDGGKNSLGTITPAGDWCRIIDYLVAERELDLEEASRLYTLFKLAGVDATSACWYAKYEHNLWRPVHAIRWGIEDENHPDADWLPMIPTSQHPEYVSGHSTACGVGAAVLSRFFGTDNVTFTITGDDAIADEKRTFTSFTEAAEEAGRSRIYGGI